MVEEVKENVGHYRPFRRSSFSSVESLRDREEKGEVGVKNTVQRGLQLT